MNFPQSAYFCKKLRLMKIFFNILFTLAAEVAAVHILQAQCEISQIAFYKNYSVGSCNGMSFQYAIGGPVAAFDDCGGRDYTSPFTSSSNTVGIDDQLIFSANVYPNPVFHTLQVDLPDLKTVVEFKILNATGQLIKSGQFHNNGNQLDLLEMENGYYFIQLNAQGFKANTKSFVKINP